MTTNLSPNTQAILLLTAPLISGRGSATTDLLSSGEYKRLARCLHDIKREPAELLISLSAEVLEACRSVAGADRLRGLLARGFQLSQALERWQTRAIWVVSRADDAYPHRLRDRLRSDAPPILYGCGDPGLLDSGGLAIVGSRNIDEALAEYTMEIGGSVANAGRTVISGGAKGIDQSAMRGALEAGGRACGVLADSLERQAMSRDHRNLLMEGRLTLVSPYDPSAGFNVGNAMQRNKLIYALADASLVVSSDVNKGGTWAGAIEQLNKFRFVPVYVRSVGTRSPGLTELLKKGALPWPELESSSSLIDVLDGAKRHGGRDSPSLFDGSEPDTPLPSLDEGEISEKAIPQSVSELGTASFGPGFSENPASPSAIVCAPGDPAEALFATVKQLIQQVLAMPMKEIDIASALGVSPNQAKAWLARLSDEGVIVRTTKPVRYKIPESRLI
jgi:DNA processing protein